MQTLYLWRKKYDGLKMDQAKRPKEVEKENGRVKRLVAELALDKQILKDIAEAGRSQSGGRCGAGWTQARDSHRTFTETFTV